MRFSLTTMLLAVTFLSVVTAFFARGNHLLGFGVGVIYAVAAILLSLLFEGALLKRPLPKGKLFVLVTFAIPVCFAFFFPAAINSDVQYFVDKVALERSAYSELAAVLNSDRAFNSMSFSIIQYRCVKVNLGGAVGSKRELLLLQSRVLNECPAIGRCCVNWRIFVDEEETFYWARDDGILLPEPK